MNQAVYSGNWYFRNENDYYQGYYNCITRKCQGNFKYMSEILLVKINSRSIQCV